ncbi:MAG TPA: Lrp/AsnC ligand binding domain-containing protein [Parafilimonas sp.]|nr:Lrp/AsnC ligand binding domain-containing protein [Parafilimonas sp.]
MSNGVFGKRYLPGIGEAFLFVEYVPGHKCSECYHISGKFEFMLKVMPENVDAYYDFHVNKLSQEEDIGHVQSVFVMGVMKQMHVLYY